MDNEFEKYKGTETILLVDDEESLRTMLSDALKSFCYQVIDAVDGQDAVEKYIQNSDKIDLVLSDIVMPRKDGISTYIDIKMINPNAKIMLMSGFIPENLQTEKNLPIITKPFSPFDVIKKIRDTLDTE